MNPTSNPTPRTWKHFPPDVTPPAGAPNVLLIMHDDVGFATSTCYGGPVDTPVFDALAESGLRYNQFHVTAMCSPTRAALLTGRNHHRVANGSICNVAVDEPGYTSVIPDSAATIAKVLKLHGYDTAMFGKHHNVPLWECGPTGPFDRWPNALGFDYFYGFIGSETNQFFPALVENRNPVLPQEHPDYILDKDLSDRAIGWLSQQRQLRGSQPFFLYLAPGTMHVPHQAPAEWIEKFRGKFDCGWDEIRVRIFKRQKELEIIPADAELTPRPPELAAWNSLGEDEKRIHARLMEVGAAQLSHSDYQIGRIISHLREHGQLENTLVLFLQGDNGGAMEGEWGNFNYLLNRFGIQELSIAKLDEAGGPKTLQRNAAAWAWAMNTPFQWGKQVASHLGGIRQGLVVSWPNKIDDVGAIRKQFHHVTDIAPTIYEAVGIDPPHEVGGVEQMRLDGVSMAASFVSADATSEHKSQYFEVMGNRAFYEDGWLASTTPARPPWNWKSTVDPLTFGWELYHLTEDYSQARDVSAMYPDKLHQLQNRFDAVAAENKVFPLSTSFLQRMDHSNRPGGFKGTEIELLPGPARYPDSIFPALKRIRSIECRFVTTPATSAGVLFMQGDFASGMSLSLEGRELHFDYNPTGRPGERVHLSSGILPEGAHVAILEIAQESGGGEGVSITMSIDGKSVAAGSAPRYLNVVGDAYIGAVGPAPLRPGHARPKVSDSTVDFVKFHLR